MNMFEVLQALQKLTNSKFTQTELGFALGKTRSDINGKIKRKSELKLSEIKQIEQYILSEYNLKINLIQNIENIKTKINTDELTADDIANIPIEGDIPTLSIGVDKTNNTLPYYKISKNLIEDLGIEQNNAQVIFASGDSMQPTIEDGDNLLIDTSKKEIQDGKLYCIKLKGRLLAKRLQIIPPDKIKVVSDNLGKYDAFYIDLANKMLDFSVIGEIRWWGRIAR